MSRKLKFFSLGRKKILFFLLIIGILIGGISIFEAKTREIKTSLADFSMGEVFENKLAIVQRNSLLPISSHSNPEPRVIKKLRVIVTGYSSTTFETDDDPYITAAGTQVREGIVANNLLPIGTKIKIPELYGDEIFVVEDRMHWKKGHYHVDIWFPSYWQAKNFGAQRTQIEILES